MANLLATACEHGNRRAVRLDGHVLTHAGLQAAAAAVVPRVEVIMTESDATSVSGARHPAPTSLSR